MIPPFIKLIKELATFSFYRDGGLYYKTSVSGFMFRIPVDDIGTGTLRSQEKAIVFLRWLKPAYDEYVAELADAQGVMNTTVVKEFTQVKQAPVNPLDDPMLT